VAGLGSPHPRIHDKKILRKMPVYPVRTLQINDPLPVCCRFLPVFASLMPVFVGF
jgi:hypothetical protein